MEQTQKQKNGFMMKLATFIVDKRNLFLLITIILLAFLAFSRNWVEVENDQTAYLPASCETKQALNVMSDQFTTYGTAEVMVANITYDEAEALSGRIGAVKGVQSVAFDETSGHYARASALFTVTFDRAETDDACLTSLDAVKELLTDYDLFVSTDLGNTLAETIDSEVSVIMVYVAVIIVAVLILTSRTYGEVPALLLTFIAAMVFMQFKIDPDMGICLMKSILFALLAVFIVMPALLVLFVPLIEKTEHRSWVPKISFAGRYAWASRKVVPFVFLTVSARPASSSRANAPTPMATAISPHPSSTRRRSRRNSSTTPSPRRTCWRSSSPPGTMKKRPPCSRSLRAAGRSTTPSALPTPRRWTAACSPTS